MWPNHAFGQPGLSTCSGCGAAGVDGEDRAGDVAHELVHAAFAGDVGRQGGHADLTGDRRGHGDRPGEVLADPVPGGGLAGKPEVAPGVSRRSALTMLPGLVTTQPGRNASSPPAHWWRVRSHVGDGGAGPGWTPR